MNRTLLALGAAAAMVAPSAHAVLDIEVVASLSLNSAFGLAFDGTNLWYSTTGTFGRIDQTTMTTLGASYSAPVWSEMAWDGSNLVFAQGSTLYQRSNVDGTATGTKTINRSAGLIDGLDIEDGKMWWSPDVSYVARFDYASGAFEAEVLPAGGGFSGVEKVSAGGNEFLIVVNDATNPRQLCRTTLSGAFNAADDCATLPNSRYEGLAFDGRYLYAADYYGGRIDKIDLIGDGGSILVPEPGTYALMGLGLVSVALARRRRVGRA